jgi:hypothetical protein
MVAEHLLESGYALPANATEASIRPLTTLPEDDELRESCWEWISCVTPERGPTARLVARVCAVVRECLENPEPCNSPRRGRPRGLSYQKPQPDTPFVKPVLRLAGARFSVNVVLLSVGEGSAANLHRSCGILAERCRRVQEQLEASFPGVVYA